jgi:hypothetical protein
VRKLILLLIAFSAIAAFFSAYGDADTLTDPQQPGIEAGVRYEAGDRH